MPCCATGWEDDEKMTDKEKIELLKSRLLLVLSCVDYTAGHCIVREMVGAALPTAIIEMAREALGLVSEEADQ